jgi:uncharacterized membrane protein
MKTKQLANILIKILGLSVIIHGLPSITTGVLTLFQTMGRSSQGGYYWLYPFSYVILVVIGICLVVKSREVAAFLFKDEDE